MLSSFSQLLDRLSEFLAHRKGLLPFIGLLLIICNLALQFFPGAGWVKDSNVLLHLGLIVAILGLMLAWAL
jgi:uncharacterized membrane protein YfhO